MLFLRNIIILRAELVIKPIIKTIKIIKQNHSWSIKINIYKKI